MKERVSRGKGAMGREERDRRNKGGVERRRREGTTGKDKRNREKWRERVEEGERE